MTFTENLTWFVIVFFFVFGSFDLIMRFITMYYKALPKTRSNHPDKNKMFFDEDTREALR